MEEQDKTKVYLRPRCQNQGATVRVEFTGDETGIKSAGFQLPQCRGCQVLAIRDLVNQVMTTSVVHVYEVASTCVVTEVSKPIPMV